MTLLQLIHKPIESDLVQFNKLYDSMLTHENELLNSILQQIAQRKGKQMRLLLTFLSAKLFGEIDKRTYYTAAAFELLHNASLVHDDIVDESNERRGQPSINAAFGNKSAVLIGDYLLGLSLQASANTNTPEVVRLVGESAGTLSNGELLQLRSVYNQKISEDIYYDIIKSKTAALFAKCAEAGALVAGADKDQQELMREFGELIGLCFQIKDDIFDYIAGAEIGKPTGNDMQEGKLTLPLIHALFTVNNPEMFAIAYKVKDGSVSADEVKTLVKFTIENNGIAYANDVIMKLASQAKNIIDSFPSSQITESLNHYVDFIIERNF